MNTEKTLKREYAVVKNMVEILTGSVEEIIDENKEYALKGMHDKYVYYGNSFESFSTTPPTMEELIEIVRKYPPIMTAGMLMNSINMHTEVIQSLLGLTPTPFGNEEIETKNLKTSITTNSTAHVKIMKTIDKVFNTKEALIGVSIETHNLAREILSIKPKLEEELSKEKLMEILDKIDADFLMAIITTSLSINSEYLSVSLNQQYETDLGLL